MNAELLEALAILEKEKNISREALLDAIQQSLILAYKNQYEKGENVTVRIDPETAEYHILAEKEVVAEVQDPALEISLAEAHKISPAYQIGDVAECEIDSPSFGRIATQNAKNVILQKIREEERKSIYNQYIEREHDIVTGVVQRYINRNISINLGRADGWLAESEQVRGENLRPTQRVKVYILEVRDQPKGPRILVSRTHPELVRRLFEEEVSEIREGIIEIKAIAREAGSRTKMAVWSHDPDVDPVGACVGLNGSRVNMIVDELHGEKIDIVNWDENEAYLIENALSPAKVISVLADPDERTALVVVPDYQLSLAIGKEGQNARLAAHLTQYKIDIKSESQAREEGIFDEYYEDEEYDEYSEESEAANILQEAAAQAAAEGAETE
ncbi:MAG: transcription termination/antitermination protein NusA [Eubacterium sp.]|nr:transcription termination/antitermination protein NusA [Eubacterium sp.]